MSVVSHDEKCRQLREAMHKELEEKLKFCPYCQKLLEPDEDGTSEVGQIWVSVWETADQIGLWRVHTECHNTAIQHRDEFFEKWRENDKKYKEQCKREEYVRGVREKKDLERSVAIAKQRSVKPHHPIPLDCGPNVYNFLYGHDKRQWFEHWLNRDD